MAVEVAVAGSVFLVAPWLEEQPTLNKGFVDARDLHEQAGKIGMGLSLDEA